MARLTALLMTNVSSFWRGGLAWTWAWTRLAAGAQSSGPLSSGALNGGGGGGGQCISARPPRAVSGSARMSQAEQKPKERFDIGPGWTENCRTRIRQSLTAKCRHWHSTGLGSAGSSFLLTSATVWPRLPRCTKINQTSSLLTVIHQSRPQSHLPKHWFLLHIFSTLTESMA